MRLCSNKPHVSVKLLCGLEASQGAVEEVLSSAVGGDAAGSSDDDPEPDDDNEGGSETKVTRKKKTKRKKGSILNQSFDHSMNTYSRCVHCAVSF